MSWWKEQNEGVWGMTKEELNKGSIYMWLRMEKSIRRIWKECWLVSHQRYQEGAGMNISGLYKLWRVGDKQKGVLWWRWLHCL